MTDIQKILESGESVVTDLEEQKELSFKTEKEGDAQQEASGFFYSGDSN